MEAPVTGGICSEPRLNDYPLWTRKCARDLSLGFSAQYHNEYRGPPAQCCTLAAVHNEMYFVDIQSCTMSSRVGFVTKKIGPWLNVGSMSHNLNRRLLIYSSNMAYLDVMSRRLHFCGVYFHIHVTIRSFCICFASFFWCSHG